ncbi:hypothetical protein GA565_08335 [Rouxiella sp. S1S-2]|uniref:hypothetical protein n=1 Tax=Rouxiella sp. S1S-2 TaxID=2653856 RepID=UPI0012651829|nr:hypothetical protein [Rouxiella sp. S1S-2]KAB7895995.1 hypothetical protein GA565_08335 [Rouxiella sp. S1S-2]
MILVVTSSFDKTIDYIVNKHGVNNFYKLNVDFFSDYKISFTREGFVISSKNNGILRESNCQSIYYRKPTPEDLDKKIDYKYWTHCFREVFSLIDGIVESFERRCLSKPSLMRRADNKILQTRVAESYGFNIPNYLITNNHESIAISGFETAIVKPLSSGLIESQYEKEYVQTNIYDKSKCTNFLKFSPSYFQEYTTKDFEIRATFVDQEDFTVKIESENKIDWRKKDNIISYSKYKLPQSIKEKCLNYMDNYGLKFGCFDFIISQCEWFFLEMNANGQWAWLEQETDLQISKSILRYLND